MTPPLPVFTPSLAPPEVLERLFVARHHLVNDIVDRIRAAATSATRNHTLLVGPRGAGKTHLISLVHHRTAQLRTACELEVQLAWLPEDPWAITSYRRLLDAIVGRLEPGLGVAEQPATIEEIEALLTGRAAELGPLVCFVENLDQVLASIGDIGQQRLRHLAQARILLFVAGTTALSRHLSDQAAPFYGFFTTTRLEPFTVEQAAEMLREIAEYQGNDETAVYLDTEQALARLRAVAHLAGGQPRIWALLAQAVTVGGLEQLVQLLLTKFDDLTPYYQEQLARLSLQQRDVVVTLAELDHPASVKELAETTGIDQRSLAKTMVELRERGWVVETDSPLVELLDRRRTYYELGEPLARLAFQLKASHGTPIRLIVEFLKSWFDPSDLEGDLLADELSVEYVRQAAAGQAADPVLTVSRRLHAVPAGRVPVLALLGTLDDALAQLVEGDPEPLLRLPSALRLAVETRLPRRATDSLLRAAALKLRIRVHEDALEELGNVPQPDGDQWYGRALALAAAADNQPITLSLTVSWLGRLRRFEEAHEALQEARRLAGDDNRCTLVARANLAASLQSAGRTAEAITAAEELTADAEGILGIDDPLPLNVRGKLAVSYWLAGRPEDAVALGEQVAEDFERVLGAQHRASLTTRGSLAVMYALVGRLEEAISIEEQVAAAREKHLGVDHPDTIASRANLALYYASAERTDEAITLAAQAAADFERIVGTEHPDTLKARRNLRNLQGAESRSCAD